MVSIADSRSVSVLHEGHPTIPEFTFGGPSQAGMLMRPVYDEAEAEAKNIFLRPRSRPITTRLRLVAYCYCKTFIS